MQDSYLDKISEKLLLTLNKCFAKGIENFSENFYRQWFISRNSNYFFLFSHNLSVTNIQLGELVALLHQYAKRKYTNNSNVPHELQFVTTNEFKQSIEQLMASFPIDREHPTPCLKKIAQIYAPILANTVILDGFFNSCSVSLPPYMSIKLDKICGASGYIHSCGQTIFIRNMLKLTKNCLFSTLHQYVHKNASNSQKIPFIVYSHEVFSTAYKKKYEGNVKDGPDDVKLYLEKCYIKDERLIEVLNEMRDHFAHDLLIPETKECLDIENYSKTLWLVRDRPINALNPKHPASETFLICYEQLYKNENPFYSFDENHPAWTTQTTMPHTLASAMINITMPYWEPRKKIVLGDPFVGSGTIYFEAKKFSQIKAICSDKEEISRILVEDNINYISSTQDELTEYIKTLELVQQIKIMNGNVSFPPQNNELNNALCRAIDLLHNKNKSSVPSIKPKYDALSVLNDFSPQNLQEKLILYICMRAKLRHAASLTYGSIAGLSAFLSEAKQLKCQFEHLKEIKVKEKVDSNKSTNLTVSSKYIHKTIGKFSPSCMVNLDKYGKCNDIIIRDALKTPALTYDVIITDPPYGINTTEDRYELAKLYSKFIEVLIKSLKNSGQIVICLPEEVRTGQVVPYFANKDIVSQYIRIAAKKLNKEIVQYHSTLPKATIYTPPYYWESEKSLSRSILHYRIRDSISKDCKILR